MDAYRIQRGYPLAARGVARARQQLPAQMAALQEQLGTGKRINRASDDASGYLQARRMEQMIRRMEGFQERIADARVWLNQGQDVLGQMEDILATILEKGIQAATPTMSQEDRQAIADSIEALRDELMDLANARVGDRYLFAGTLTQTQPFVKDSSGNVVYQGNTQSLRLSIDTSTTVDLSFSGQTLQDVDGTSTLFQRIDALVQEIRTGNIPAISARNDEVESARDHIIALNAELGERSRRLSLFEDYHERLKLELTSRQSDVEDADMAEVLTRLQRTQLAFESTLKTTASLLQTSLLQYL